MIYLDSCALVKLITEEDETAALQTWLDDHGDVLMVTSELAHAEVHRVVRRNNHTAAGTLLDAERLALDLADAEEILASVEFVTLTGAVLRAAGAYEAPMLRTLDAIHLVSALTMPSSGPAGRQLVTYDRALAAVARDAGLTIVTPREGE